MGPQAKVSPVLAFLTNDVGDSLIFNAFFSIISYRPSWSQTCSLFALASQIFRLEGCYTMPGPAVTLLWNFDKYILMLSCCFLYKSLNSKILQTIDLAYLYLIKYVSKHCFLCRNMAADLFFLLTLTFNDTSLHTILVFMISTRCTCSPKFLLPGCCWLRVSGPLKKCLPGPSGL